MDDETEGGSGGQSRRLLVVYEDGRVPDSDVEFVLEMARRILCDIMLLMLISGNSMVQIERAAEPLEALAAALQRGGVATRTAVRRGNKTSELLKVLGQEGAFVAVAWGGQSLTLRRSRRKASSHWMVRMVDRLGCPVVTLGRTNGN